MIRNDIAIKATKSKTLFALVKKLPFFDFLYLRKNVLVDGKAVEELRLNLNNFTAGNMKELEKYVNLEGSKKMRNILNLLIRLWKH